MSRVIEVSIAQGEPRYRVGKTPDILMTKNLVVCVPVIFYDEQFKIGTLIHMVPDYYSTIKALLKTAFAETIQKGASRENISAQIYYNEAPDNEEWQRHKEIIRDLVDKVQEFLSEMNIKTKKPTPMPYYPTSAVFLYLRTGKVALLKDPDPKTY